MNSDDILFNQSIPESRLANVLYFGKSRDDVITAHAWTLLSKARRSKFERGEQTSIRFSLREAGYRLDCGDFVDTVISDRRIMQTYRRAPKY